MKNYSLIEDTIWILVLCIGAIYLWRYYLQCKEKNRETKKIRLHSGGILAFGNPLVDIVSVVSKEFLSKNSLSIGTEAPSLDMATKEKILKKVETNPTTIACAGGSALNTIKVAQWLLHKQPGMTSFIGAIGDDENAKFLVDSCRNSGVYSLFQLIRGEKTGKCVCLVTEKERTLFTVQGAHRFFSRSYLANTSKTFQIAKYSRLIYTTTFSLPIAKHYEYVETLADFALKYGKLFALNLSSATLIQNDMVFFRLSNLLHKTHLIFGNVTEARAFAKMASWHDASDDEIARRLSLQMQPSAKVILTNSQNPTIMFDRESKACISVPVLPVDDTRIIDTTGCGDSFVGGYLAAIVRKLSARKCVEAGHYCAFQCLQNMGSQFSLKTPSIKPFQ